MSPKGDWKVLSIKKSGYIFMVLLFIISISVWADTTDDIVDSMRETLQDSCNEIPNDKVKDDSFSQEKWIFERFAYNGANKEKYIYFKSKNGEFVKDYGTMFKRIGIAEYSFADSAVCDSFMIAILKVYNVSLSQIQRLFDTGFVRGVKSPIYLLLKMPTGIIKVKSRCEDFPGSDGAEEWKKMIMELLGYPNPVNVDKTIICYCGGPLMIVDSTYFSYDSIMPPGR
jgi:hypothetical protein